MKHKWIENVACVCGVIIIIGAHYDKKMIITGSHYDKEIYEAQMD